MPPKRKRKFHGLYYHSSPPKVLPMNGHINGNTQKSDGSTKEALVVKPSNIRIWIHDKDIGKLTRVLWTGQANRLRTEVSSHPKVKKFLEMVPFVMNNIKDVHQSVIDNNVEGLQAKIEPPVPPSLVTAKDSNGLTVMHKAAGLAHTSILEYLLKIWPDGVSDIDATGKTPLHWAASAKNNSRCYNVLVEAGAEEDALDFKMKMPAYYKQKPNDIDRSLLTVIPEAPRISVESKPDWSVIVDDIGKLRADSIANSNNNSQNGTRRGSDVLGNGMNLLTSRSRVNSIENTSEPEAMDEDVGHMENGNVEVEQETNDDDERSPTPFPSEAMINDINDDDNKSGDELNANEDNVEQQCDNGDNEMTEEGIQNSDDIVTEKTDDNEQDVENEAVAAEEIEVDVEIEPSQEIDASVEIDENDNVNDNGNENEEENVEDNENEDKDENANENENGNDNKEEKDNNNDDANVEVIEDDNKDVEEDTGETLQTENEDSVPADENIEVDEDPIDSDVVIEVGEIVEDKETAEENEEENKNDEENLDELETAVEADNDEVEDNNDNEMDITEKEEKHNPPNEEEAVEEATDEAIQDSNVDEKGGDVEEIGVDTNEKDNEEPANEDKAELNEAVDDVADENDAEEQNTVEPDPENADGGEQRDVNDYDNEEFEEADDENQSNVENPSENEMADDDDIVSVVGDNIENDAETVMLGEDNENADKCDADNGENADVNVSDNTNADKADADSEANAAAAVATTAAAVAAAAEKEDEDDDEQDVELFNSAAFDIEEYKFDENHNTLGSELNGETSPSPAMEIEGVVHGEPDNNQVQSQSGGHALDEASAIQSMIKDGDMERLATIVLNGEGRKLIGAKTDQPEIQAFLSNVPAYMSKIRQVHLAARDGDLKELQAALDRRKFAIAKDEISPMGASPLHVATVFGHGSVVRYLGGRFPETTSTIDDNGRIALHYAATINDNYHFYNMLVHLGSNPKATDKLGNSAENYRDRDQYESVLSHRQLLKEFGVDENVEDVMLSDQVPDDVHSARKPLDDADVMTTLDRCFRLMHEPHKTTDPLGSATPSSASSLRISVTSYLSKFLKRSIFDKIKHRQTKLDHNLFDVIWPAMKKSNQERRIDEDLNAGIIAPDYDVYVVFQEFMVPLIKDMHCMNVSQEFKPHPRLYYFPPTDGKIDPYMSITLDVTGKYIQDSHVECCRNLNNFELPLNLNIGQMEQAERILIEKILTTDFAIAIDEIEAGTYYTMNEVLESPSEIRTVLAASKLLIPLLDTSDSQQVAESLAINGQYWPYGRGVFISHSGDLVAWINVQEHLRLMVCTPSDTPSDVGYAYSKIGRAIMFLEEKMHFRESYFLGYLSSRPSYLGTSLKLSATFQLPNLFKEVENLRHLCTVRGLNMIPNFPDETVRLVNMQSLGINEWQIFQDYCTAVVNILQLEKDMSLTNSKQIAAMLVKIFRRKKNSLVEA